MKLLKEYIHKEIKYIHSFELYSHLGLSPVRYARWVRRWVEKGHKNKDYFSTRKYPKKFKRSVGQPRYKDYLLTISFASTLCFNADTEESTKVRLWLSSL